MPKLSVLVVTWNSWSDLRRCLASIQASSSSDYEIVVIDNGSADATVANTRREFPAVRLVENPVNLGLPPAVNQGFREVRGEYVLLLDVDTELGVDMIDTLLRFLERREDVSLVAPRIYNPRGEIEQSARNLPSLMNGLFGRQSILTRMFPGNPFSGKYLMVENLAATEPFQVEQVSAACMLMRRSLIDEVGPWDEGYRCYWIDSDFCARLKKLGRKVYCVPGASIVHYENNNAARKKAPWRIRHFHMGAYRLYRKHYTLGALDPRAILAALALGLRAVLLLIQNELKVDDSPSAP